MYKVLTRSMLRSWMVQLFQYGSMFWIIAAINPVGYGRIILPQAIFLVLNVLVELGLPEVVSSSGILKKEEPPYVVLNTAVSGILSLILMVLGVYVSSLDVTLTSMYAIVLLVSGPSSIIVAHERRLLHFDKLLNSAVISHLVALLAIVAVGSIVGVQVWLIIAYLLVQKVIESLTLLNVSEFQYGRLRQWRIIGDGEIVRKAFNIALSNGLPQVTRSGTDVIVVIALGAPAAAIVSFGFKIVRVAVTTLSAGMEQFMMPYLASDTKKHSSLRIVNLVTTTFVVLYTIAATIMLYHSNTLEKVLGQGDWGSALPFARYFVYIGLLQLGSSMYYSFYSSSGAYKMFMYITLISSVINVLFVGVGTYYGIEGVLIGFSVRAILIVPVFHYYTRTFSEGLSWSMLYVMAICGTLLLLL